MLSDNKHDQFMLTIALRPRRKIRTWCRTEKSARALATLLLQLGGDVVKRMTLHSKDGPAMLAEWGESGSE